MTNNYTSILHSPYIILGFPGVSAVGNQEKFVYLQNVISTFTEGYLKACIYLFIYFFEVDHASHYQASHSQEFK